MASKKKYEWTNEEKFHLELTKILCDCDCGNITDTQAVDRIMTLDINRINSQLSSIRTRR